MSQGLDGVRQAARERKQERFTALLHHLSIGLLHDSFHALQHKASPGVDGVTWQEYECALEDRLVDLHSWVHRGTNRAKPSRRVFIPKADGRQRPLGIAASGNSFFGCGRRKGKRRLTKQPPSAIVEGCRGLAVMPKRLVSLSR
jgi:hypothetical protein